MESPFGETILILWLFFYSPLFYFIGQFSNRRTLMPIDKVFLTKITLMALTSGGLPEDASFDT